VPWNVLKDTSETAEVFLSPGFVLRKVPYSNKDKTSSCRLQNIFSFEVQIIALESWTMQGHTMANTSPLGSLIPE